MYVLFDIGGTKTRVATSNDLKTFATPIVVDTPKDFEGGIELLEKCMKDLQGNGEIDDIAGGIAGPLNAEKTMAVGGPNITGYHNKPIKNELEKRLGAPVSLENDAAMGALGESNFGAGRGHKIVVYVTVSTGVGGAKVIDGKLSPSSQGFEPGWQIIDAGNTMYPGASDNGYLGDYISGANTERLTGKKPYDIHDENFWEEKAKYLAYGLNNMAVIWSPDVIVLGGSMMKEVGIPLESVKKQFAGIFRAFPKAPEIKKAELGDEISLWGAMAYLKEMADG